MRARWLICINVSTRLSDFTLQLQGTYLGIFFMIISITLDLKHCSDFMKYKKKNNITNMHLHTTVYAYKTWFD